MQTIIKEDIEQICCENLPWEKLRNKRVLITGANGFLGAYIVFCLIECNEKYQMNIVINALCRNKEKAYIRFNEFFQRNDLQFIFQDVCEEIEDIYKSDVIIHAASPANPYIVQQEPYKVVVANVLGYSNLLKKVEQWETEEVILFSSSAVYGYSTSIQGANENFRDNIDFTNYKDVYCLSKQMCEMMSTCYMKEKDVQIKTLRPFVVYGPGDDLKSHKAIIDFINDCLEDRNIILKSNGEAIRSYVYIKDAIRAFFYIWLKGKEDVYNISSTENIYDIKQIASIFCEVNKKIKIEMRIDDKEYLKTQSRIMIGTNERLKRLGWTETVSIKEGIARTIKWGKGMRENII
ncbi:MAG: NAD(P)-dependent oxidoreductase [Lachnospiraceae bacterium]|jgi:nucleoside-diphosphate-sugar epimerase|nr:NAD(P)-dependent oxidoreductase [Lachnospiraceae bacterium]